MLSWLKLKMLSSKTVSKQSLLILAGTKANHFTTFPIYIQTAFISAARIILFQALEINHQAVGQALSQSIPATAAAALDNRSLQSRAYNWASWLISHSSRLCFQTKTIVSLWRTDGFSRQMLYVTTHATIWAMAQSKYTEKCRFFSAIHNFNWETGVLLGLKNLKEQGN